MRVTYRLGLAECVALALLAGGGGSAPAQRTTPIQPVPTGTTRIQPTTTTTPAVYPPAQSRVNRVGPAVVPTPNQSGRPNGVTGTVEGQSGEPTAVPGADRVGNPPEPNQLFGPASNRGVSDLFTTDRRLRHEYLARQFAAYDALSTPEVQERLNLPPGQVRNLRANGLLTVDQMRAWGEMVGDPYPFAWPIPR